MLTSNMWGDILRFVVRAVPRQHNNEKEIQKVLEKLLTNESGHDKISELPLRTTATKESLIFDK